MDVIPVIDLAGGLAVHARGGDRTRYPPVRSAVAPGSQGDPSALLRGYREMLGAKACYVADLDAIRGGAVQRATLAELARLEARPAGPLLVDAGASGPDGAHEVLSSGASEVVIGLETLRAFADLGAVVDQVGPSRVIFSLDLRLGQPMLHSVLEGVVATGDPLEVAARAVGHGVHTLLVVDVGRVGTGCGVDLDLVARLRSRLPSVRLIAGGGVMTRRDLDRMRDAGCDGALVASAVHSGAITSADVAALATPPDPAQSAARL